MLDTPLKWFRNIGILEGWSFILLLGIAMPLKYIADIPQFVTVIGMAHGILFMLYLAIALYVTVKYKWPLTRFIGATLAAVTPFGPFIYDARILKPYKTEVKQSV
ncbi:DUF3817 domain-containing protein [Alkalihalobacterium alkalinitrilicum]|uniref:DUF3817 domain-containing protein n=1 Tax=Alkalihalobacterium alkalinitrilicum TaxID=427920 RepID=UPI000994B943|nr:DUF3817 domain-containing protein [Alkalihalobacterium alkalinitrilicum]